MNPNESTAKPPKQVLVMRKFPSLRTGKYCSQAAHASGKSILDNGTFTEEDDELIFTFKTKDPAIKAWFKTRFTKITVYVTSEEELLALHQQAQAAGLLCSLIEDIGATEFKGTPTKTALAIGPGPAELIDPITGKLPLF